MGFRDSVLGSVSPWGLRGIRAVEAAPDLQVALGGFRGFVRGACHVRPCFRSRIVFSKKDLGHCAWRSFSCLSLTLRDSVLFLNEFKVTRGRVMDGF